MTSPVTILLLDDEPLLRSATALILSRHGARVTPAASVGEAVALAGERRYDVAVLDVASLDAGGAGGGAGAVDAIRRIRAGGLLPKRVIVVSAVPLEPGDAALFTEVLPRPYPFERLLRAALGVGGRGRTRSGVFARALMDPARTRQAGTAGGPSPRGTVRALRGRGG
jgi:CheY-like chemotaxis protein